MMIDQDNFDDFDDIDLDDIEDLDDDWDELEDLETIENNSSKAKTRKSSSKLFTFIVVFVALAIGGFILFTTFKPMLQNAANTENVLASQAQNDEPVQDEENLMNEDSLFAQDDGLPPMPTPLTGNQAGSAKTPELTPLPEFDDIELENLPDLTSDLQTSQEMQAVADPVVVEPPTIAIPSPAGSSRIEQEVVSSAPVSRETDNTAQDLVKRFETLQTDMTSQLSERDFRLDLLSEKIDRVEKTLMNIESHLSDNKVSSANKSMDSKTKPKQTKKASKPAPIVPKSQKPVIKKPKPKQTVWILRSAQPGKATVAPKGSNDIRSISVGESLSGIGRIQSISNASGRWVVTGTTGSISQ